MAAFGLGRYSDQWRNSALRGAPLNFSSAGAWIRASCAALVGSAEVRARKIAYETKQTRTMQLRVIIRPRTHT